MAFPSGLVSVRRFFRLSYVDVSSGRAGRCASARCRSVVGVGRRLPERVDRARDVALDVVLVHGRVAEPVGHGLLRAGRSWSPARPSRRGSSSAPAARRRRTRCGPPAPRAGRESREVVPVVVQMTRDVVLASVWGRGRRCRRRCRSGRCPSGSVMEVIRPCPSRPKATSLPDRGRRRWGRAERDAVGALDLLHAVELVDEVTCAVLSGVAVGARVEHGRSRGPGVHLPVSPYTGTRVTPSTARLPSVPGRGVRPR